MEKLVVMVGLKQSGNNIQLLGSCFAVPKNGYFVTCRHVIGDHTDNLVLVSSVDSNNIHEYQDTSKKQCSILDVQTIECVKVIHIV